MSLAFVRRLAATAAVAIALTGSGSALAADPLVSPQWLAANKDSGKVVVLDIRSKK